MDPAKERPVGSGDANTAIVIHPICKQSIFAGWPTSADDYVSCGSLASEPFVSTAPGKYLLFQRLWKEYKLYENFRMF